MTKQRPRNTGTSHVLPFERLSPYEFERLCLWLVEREGYEQAEHLGASGSEQARDILAWRSSTVWAFQCKRVQHFGPKDALAEVERVLALPAEERPTGLVFLVTCNVSATTRRRAGQRCGGALECRFWAGTELDQKVKRHPDILKEFFQIPPRTEWTIGPALAKKLFSWVAGLSALAVAVVGYVRLWQGYTDLFTVMLLLLGIGSGTLGCAYVLFLNRARARDSRGGNNRGRDKGIWARNRPSAKHRWALTGLIVIPLLASIVIGVCLYIRSLPPGKIIILVADFDGPEPAKYGVTEAVLNNLRRALQPYDDVKVVPLQRVIAEIEGRDVARIEGQRRKATIVIWGWYRTPGQVVPLSVNFEVLRPTQLLPELGLEAKGLVQTYAMSELENFTLQTDLSSAMSYLSLFTAGVARCEAKDWEEAISRFTDALNQTSQPVSALDRGIILKYRGNANLFGHYFEDAIADYTQAIELNPMDAEAYHRRGVAHAMQCRFDQAITDFDQAIVLDPQFALAYGNRGAVYGRVGQLEQALADLNQAMTYHPENVTVWVNRGNVHYLQGALNEAITDYTQAITLDPQRADAYNNRASTNVKSGELEHAISDYTRAITMEPFDARIYHRRGLAYAQQENLEQAIADFTQAINLDPHLAEAFNNRGLAHYQKDDFTRALEDLDAAIALKPEYAAAYYNRGLVHDKQGEAELAIADYSQAIALDSGETDAYFKRGLVYANTGEMDLAIANFTQVIVLDPDHVMAYYNRGSAYYHQRKFEQAIEDFNQTVALDERFVNAYVNRGISYQRLGDMRQALSDYARAIDLDPRSAEAYNNRGTAYYEQNKLQQAIADYTEVIALRPDDADAYYNRGLAYYHQDALEQAISDFNRAIELHVDCGACVYNFRGRAYLEKGDLDQAVADLTLAIQLAPSFTDAYYHRGRAHALRHEENKAIADFEKVLELGDDPQLVTLAKEQLRALGDR